MAAARPRTRRLTMADVKSANKAYHRRQGDDWSFFDRKTSKFFGGDTYAGPYVGAGGIYFVISNKAGVSIRRSNLDGSIGTPVGKFARMDTARETAQKLAKG